MPPSHAAINKSNTSFNEKYDAPSTGTAFPFSKISWTGPWARSLSISRSTEIINTIAEIKIPRFSILILNVIENYDVK
jgi:hypothetical protein